MIKFTIIPEDRNFSAPLTLPVNPESIQDGSRNNNRTVEIVGQGEISIPGSSQLRRWTISSLFWAAMPTGTTTRRHNAETYKQYFNNLKNAKMPFRFVVEGLKIDSRAIIEEFVTEYKQGEENDIYYKLDIIEHPRYGAKRVEIPIVLPPPPAPVPDTPPAPQLTLEGLSIGMIVYFTGGLHHHTSYGDARGGNRSEGLAKITNLNRSAPFPIHLIGESWNTGSGSNVWGWVTLSQVRLP